MLKRFCIWLRSWWEPAWLVKFRQFEATGEMPVEGGDDDYLCINSPAFYEKQVYLNSNQYHNNIPQSGFIGRVHAEVHFKMRKVDEVMKWAEAFKDDNSYASFKEAIEGCDNERTKRSKTA